jgi:hypothetical protein
MSQCNEHYLKLARNARNACSPTADSTVTAGLAGILVAAFMIVLLGVAM